MAVDNDISLFTASFQALHYQFHTLVYQVMYVQRYYGDSDKLLFSYL